MVQMRQERYNPDIDAMELAHSRRNGKGQEVVYARDLRAAG
jgi:hypothetical protein